MKYLITCVLIHDLDFITATTQLKSNSDDKSNIGRLSLLMNFKTVTYLYPVPEVPPVLTLSQKDPVILRKGETFELSCSSANVNPDFSVKWDFPSTAVRIMFLFY